MVNGWSALTCSLQKALTERSLLGFQFRIG